MTIDEPWTITVRGTGDTNTARAVYHEVIDRLRQQGLVVIVSAFEVESDNVAVGSYEEPHPVRRRQKGKPL